jgi:hypothetical protein
MADFFDSGHLEDQGGRNHTNFCHKMEKNLQFVPDYIHSIITFLQMSVSYRLNIPGTAAHCRLWKPRISRVYEPKLHLFNQVSSTETALHVLQNYEVLAVTQILSLGMHFTTPSDQH